MIEWNTYLSAFLGFLSAIAVFFIKECWESRKNKKTTIENLKLEITYNINLYDKFEKEIQDCIEALSNDQRNIYLHLDYAFVATTFAKAFYNSGLLLKYFHPEDMHRWNVMLSQISDGGQNYIVDCTTLWRDNENIKKEELYKSLKHEKNQIVYAKEMSQYILAKISA
ncbi:MAG: hypothetical protein KA099_00585 [Alphaproteobacteria bacterium]|nr:hypothetical protein [Alphaproteobacteria bacterium]MBP7757935.1 hypothetical protein [Alphaproteobacteria bacterium]MBP7761262.1 hypothetical protein [Alphaproteobacteria bacterium]MBP7903796.1 hypothetical protein [Alphaproteobacteria bacterium]